MQRTASVEINLDALTHNLSVVRSHAGNAKIMAVIKANAYGHGMLKIAQHLQDKVDALAVACVEEAVVLRKAGINTRIVVLQGFHHADHLQQCDQYKLEPVCHQVWQLELLQESTIAQPLKIWLKVDTGMHRLGLSAEEAKQAFLQLQNCDQVEKTLLMSHFANADEPENILNQQQLERFNNLLAALSIEPSLESGPESSLANSAGIVSIPGAIKDWVRPGIMLYGASPLMNKTAAELGLKSVMRLSSTVIALTDVKVGEAIGYGSTWTCEADSKIAVIAIGYGDGYPRHAQSGTAVAIHGQRCPLVGRVSMDMICVDISKLDEVVNVSDVVVLWAENPSVDEVAKTASTIGYELLCHAGKDQ